MKPSKPDWAERAVAKGYPYQQVRQQDLIPARQAIRLLRAYERRVVRMVKRLPTRGYDNHGQAVYELISRDDLLAALRGEG